MNDRLRSGLAAVSARPAALAGFALFLNAVLSPYLGVAHDAHFYAGQVVTRLDPERLAKDPFFRYGSQDRFSAFSRVTAPVTRAIGVPAAFAAGYFASIGLFAYGFARVATSIFPGGIMPAVVTLAAVVAEVPYGGAALFAVPEGFLTPRTAACGFALLGLDRALAGRGFAGAILFAAAFAAHPLMAVGPAAMAVLGAVATRFGWKLAGGLVAAAGLGLILAAAVEPVGFALFGPMDAEWKAAVGRTAKFNYPAEWFVSDWLRMSAAGVTLILAAREHPPRSLAGATLRATVAVGAAGMVSFAAAAELPYALLFQGQGFRGLWVWAAFHVPAAAWLCSRWRGTPRAWAGIGLLAAAVWLAAPAPVGGIPGIADVKVLLGILGDVEGFRALRAEYANWPMLLPRTFTPSARGVFAAGIVAAFAGILGRRPRLAGGLGAAAAAGLTALAATTAERPAAAAAADRAFVADRVTEMSAGGAKPVVFWAGPVTVSDFWQTLGVACYHHPAQGAGAIFTKKSAVEIDARAEVAKPFWAYAATWAADFYGPGSRPPPPTEADLRRLAADPELGLIILPFDFPGLWTHTNGRLFAYDPRTLRGPGKFP